MTAVSASPARRRASTTGIALCAAAAVAAGSVIALSLASFPVGNEGWQHAARYTARFAFLVFLPVFVARPWHQLWPSRASHWLVKNRRSLGLTFATAHFIHLYALIRFSAAADRMPDLVTLLGGGGAYLMLAAMAATSNDAAVRALGARNWKRLHTVGIFWLWFIFFQSYAGRVAAGDLFFVPLLALALGGLTLRIAARVKKRRAS